MKYDFTSILDRRGKDAAAYDNVGAHVIAPARPKEGFDIIPMWVADMNFPVVPTIPSFGYFFPTDKYYDSIVQWHEKRNGVTGLTKEHIGYENGVLGGVVSALNVLCSRGDNVLVHSPTYSGFTSCLTNAGYSIVLSPLVQDEQGIWRMDFEDMEKKIVANHIHTALFCSPHNPTGRVWERWELEKAMEIFQRHGVYVISDEIWSDIIRPGQKHIPTQMVNSYAKEHTVALYAPSKTFNLAGLQISNIFVPNPELRKKLLKEITAAGYSQVGLMGLVACQAAYEEGAEWLAQLKAYLEENRKFVKAYLEEHLPEIRLIEPEGTYLLWLDFKALHLNEKELEHLIVDKAHLWLDSGAMFGPDGEGFERINIACPRATVEKALKQLEAAIRG